MTFEQAVKKLALTLPISKQPVQAKALIDILKQDVIRAAVWPDCTEGQGMLEILSRHGFLNNRENQ